MALPTKTFRIFVSSTFSDLKAERNALQECVFPRLSELCASRGCRFQAIDLRWGVSEEASLDQQTMKICLGEIERCQKTTPRPNFIVLLGDRYGWRPLPARIPASEFESLLDNVAREDHQLLLDWYRRDDNALPRAIYCLQPRTEQYEVYEVWEPVERRLHALLEAGAQGVELLPDERLKYNASATEQEITAGALQVPDAHEHVFCYFRQIEGLPNDKRAVGFVDLDAEGMVDVKASEMLTKLKAKLKGYLPDSIHQYTSRWEDDGPSLDHLERLCEDVYQDLARVILAEIDLREEEDPLEREIRAHEDFGLNRRRGFMGRVEPLNRLARYLERETNYPLVIWGESGSGKSALMAKAAQQARQQRPRSTIILRFIGATPESSHPVLLLKGICQQIYDLYDLGSEMQGRLNAIDARGEEAEILRQMIASEYEISEDLQQLTQALSRFLKKVPQSKPLILFIDALDQLAPFKGTRSLAWLPTRLPPNVHLVVSSLPDEKLTSLRSRLLPENLIQVLPMSVGEAEVILEGWLAESGRRLQDRQRNAVMRKFKCCGLPLYFKLGFEEAKRWKSYDPTPEWGDDIPGMIRSLFARLSLEANHGQRLVRSSLGYIAAAKNGLSEDELLEVLSEDPKVRADFLRRSPKSPEVGRLPMVVWSRLYYDLEPYLTERASDGTSLLGFYHRQLNEVVQADFLSGETRRERHRTLARYFGEKPLYWKAGDERTPNLRRLSELAFQQTFAHDWSGLEGTLTDLEFIQTKFAAGMSQDLLSDYNRLGIGRGTPGAVVITAREYQGNFGILCPHCVAISEIQGSDLGQSLPCPICQHPLRVNEFSLPLAWQSRHRRREIESDPQSFGKNCSDVVTEFADFVTQEAPNLSNYPAMTFQQAINQPDSSAPARSARSLLAQRGEEYSWIEYVNKPQAINPFIKTVPAGLQYKPDGKQWFEVEGKELILSDALDGLELKRFLVGEDEITSACFSTCGELILTGSEKGSLMLTDVHSGNTQLLPYGHRGSVLSCKWSMDDRWIFSYGEDHKIKRLQRDTADVSTIDVAEMGLLGFTLTPDGQEIRLITKQGAHLLMDSGTGELLGKLQGPGPIEGYAFSTDTRWLAMWSANWAGIYDLREGDNPATLYSPQQIIHCAFAPDLKYLAVGTQHEQVTFYDRLQLYETQRWQKVGEVGPMHFGERRLGPITFSKDGQMLISGGNCFHLKSILGRAADKPERPFFSRGIIPSLVYSGDGEHILAASDNQLGLLDAESGEIVRILTGRSEKVRAVSFNQDGDIVAAEGNQLCVWESHSGELQKQMITHEDPIVDVACSCDFVVSATGDGHVIIWSDGAEYDELFYPGPLYAVACSRQGNLLATCEDQAIKLWDIEGGDEILLEGHTASVRKCAFSPDDALIVSYGDDQTLRTWDVLRGEERARTKTSETVVALGWMESGRDAVAICASGSLMSWDIDSQEPPTLVKVCASPVTIGAISEDGRLAIIATAQREIILWDVQDSEKVCHIHNLSSQIVSCAISPEGDMLVVGLEDTSLELRQVKNGLVDKTIGGHSDQILDCDITGDGALIASASMDGTAKLWDGLTGRDLATLRDHSGSVTAAAFSPEGLNLATGDYDGHVRIWDFEAWDHYRIGAWEDDDAPEIGLNAMFPRWTDENIDDLAYSPKNGFLVAAANGVIKVLSEFEQDIAADLQSGGHACFFSPDGTSILTVSSNQTYLWDAETFELIKSFPRGEYICGISRDADWIINGDRSYGLSIWSLRTGREVIRFFMQDWPVSLAVCPVRDEFAITGYFAELRILRYHISPSAEVEDRRRTTPPRDREEPQRTTEFDTAALISPEDLIQSGKGAMDQGDIAGALDYFEQAVEVLPDDLDALSYRVTALLRLGKNEEALVQLDGILDRNLALGPNLACMYVGKAKALTGLGRNADALHFYDRALALVDDDRNIWFSRGHVFYLMEQYEHALENFQRANALSEEEKTTEFIGWSLLGARRYLKSENIFAMLISRGPRDPLSWYGLALSENELNKKVQARTHLERFIQEARPEHAGILPQARGILRNLRRDEG